MLNGMEVRQGRAAFARAGIAPGCRQAGKNSREKRPDTGARVLSPGAGNLPGILA